MSYPSPFPHKLYSNDRFDMEERSPEWPACEPSFLWLLKYPEDANLRSHSEVWHSHPYGQLSAPVRHVNHRPFCYRCREYLP